MNINFSVIQVIVYAGFLLSLANVFINVKLKSKSPFVAVIQSLNFYLLLHFTFIWMIETIWTGRTYLDQMAPFSLFYGTFLYVSNFLTRNEKITFRKLIPHLVAPVFFWLWFFWMLFQGVTHTNPDYVRLRMITAILLLSSYILGAVFFNKKPILPAYRFVRPIIISGSIVLVIMVIIAIRVAAGNTAVHPDGVTSIRSVVYLCMLACAILVFRVQIPLLTWKHKDFTL